MTFIRKKGKRGSNFLLVNARGMFGDDVVIKQYKNKIVLAKPPVIDSKRKPTPRQAQRRKLMRKAVLYAKLINSNPEFKAKWKKLAKKYSNVYQAVISTFMKVEGDRSKLPDLGKEPIKSQP